MLASFVSDTLDDVKTISNATNTLDLVKDATKLRFTVSLSRILRDDYDGWNGFVQAGVGWRW